jgi:hypothetical protein
MAKERSKCIVILSSKSSGSSALQKLLTSFDHVHHVRRTRHFEFETLYWVKAASILGLPQVEMLDSEVPISKRKAHEDLITLLRDNLESYIPPENEEELIFEGWRLLCNGFSPVFVEKSPHHLQQWSALELLMRCMEKLPGVDFLFVGLVRNPMATLYSAWKRWGALPEENQFQWLQAYKNLIAFKELVKEKLVIVRYEDMASDISTLARVFSFIDADAKSVEKGTIHSRSLMKWREDGLFGFMPSRSLLALAQEFGYKAEHLVGNKNRYWKFYRNMPRPIRFNVLRARNLFRE